MHRPRRAGQERGELAPGAGPGEGFERLAAGEHQRDHGAGQVLAERERSRHGQQGDEVHPELAVPQVPDHGENQRQEDHGGGERPQGLGDAAGSGQPRQAARENAGDGEKRKAAGHRPCFSRTGGMGLPPQGLEKHAGGWARAARGTTPREGYWQQTWD